MMRRVIIAIWFSAYFLSLSGMQGDAYALVPANPITRVEQAIIAQRYDAALVECSEIMQATVDDHAQRAAREKAMQLVLKLADKHAHLPSKFYAIKHLVNSPLPKNISKGLHRFERLPVYGGSHIENRQYTGQCFKYSGLLGDIKRLADEKQHAHAQYVMAKAYLEQAQYGRDIDNKKIEYSAIINHAHQYAVHAAQNGHDDAKILVQLIEQHRSSQWLYQQGKKLVEADNSSGWQEGLRYLDHAQQLGNPFAAELIGDQLFETDPERATAHYFKAMDIYTTAPKKSVLRQIRGFVVPRLQKKLDLLDQEHANKPTIRDYQSARNALLLVMLKKQWGEPFKADDTERIEFACSLVNNLETYFKQHAYEIDSCCMQAIATSGVLDALDACKMHKKIPGMLIGVLITRAQVGRGFVLPQKTKLAHYAKALQFIVAPEQAVTQSLFDPVASTIGLQKIEVAHLPEEGQSFYFECMFGIIEQLIATQTLEKKQAIEICKLFCTVTQALDKLDNKYLDALFIPRMKVLLSCMKDIALTAQSTEQKLAVGKVYVSACKKGIVQGMRFSESIQAVQDLLEAVYKKGGRYATREVKELLAYTNASQAFTALLSGAQDDALRLFKISFGFNPDDQVVAWRLAQLLMEYPTKKMQQEGLRMMHELADKQHAQSLIYLADRYYSGMPGLLQPDFQKAISYLKQIIAHPSIDAPSHRVLLARIYSVQAIEAKGLYQKKLLAKAEDLVRPFADTNDDAHIVLIDILRFQGRVHEVIHELERHWPATVPNDVVHSITLADAYVRQAKEHEGALHLALYKKAAAVLEPIQYQSIPALLMRLNILFTLNAFTELAVALQKQNMSSQLHAIIKHLYSIRTVLKQQGAVCAERIIEPLEQLLDGFKLLNGEKKLLSTYVESVIMEMFAVVTEGACSDIERNQLLAYAAYFGAKFALACKEDIGKDLLTRFIKPGIEAALRAKDKNCCQKILNLLSEQLYIWLAKQKTATNVRYAIDVVQALMTMKKFKLCSYLDKQQAFADMLHYTQEVLEKLDITPLDEKDKSLIEIQKKLLIRLQTAKA